MLFVFIFVESFAENIQSCGSCLPEGHFTYTQWWKVAKNMYSSTVHRYFWGIYTSLEYLHFLLLYTSSPLQIYHYYKCADMTTLFLETLMQKKIIGIVYTYWIPVKCNCSVHWCHFWQLSLLLNSLISSFCVITTFERSLFKTFVYQTINHFTSNIGLATWNWILVVYVSSWCKGWLHCVLVIE